MTEECAFEIGKFYRVPCVTGKYFCYVADWPVIGPVHTDHDFIRFDYPHYHIDWRFVPRSLFASIGYAIGSPLMTSARINEGGLPRPVLRRRKMVRPLPDMVRVRAANWFPKLEKAYAECKLKPGLICPHRGLPLAGANQVGDVVTCPGHGLRWNVKTGELVTDLSPSSQEARNR